MRQRALVIAIVLLLPLRAFAYPVPERDYWRAFTLSLINGSRAEHDLPPIGLDEELNNLSQAHANDSATHYEDATMGARRATYLMHVSSDGRTLGDRVRDEGITGASAFGENVGLRFNSGFADVHAAIEEALAFMHAGMMAEVPPDDGHRATILKPVYSHVGVGLELHRKAGEAPNTLFLVTDFAEFGDARESIIPPVGVRPMWISPSTAPPKETSEAKERSKRVRARTVDRARRRAIEIVPPTETVERRTTKTLRGRMEERRAARLQRR